jgi:hypothetical protein
VTYTAAMLLAHLGHWYVSLLYLGPLAVIVVFLTIQSRRDKRRGRKDR